jgi:limonene-1,2-epoxide hydrolase
MNVEAEHRVVEFLSLFDGAPPTLKGLAAYLSADARLANPVSHAAPIVGREAIVSHLSAIVSRYRSCSFKTLAMASQGSQVFTERIDTIVLGDGRKIEAFICGVFDVNPSGQITSWREYWDPADAKAQLAGAKAAG